MDTEIADFSLYNHLIAVIKTSATSQIVAIMVNMLNKLGLT